MLQQLRQGLGSFHGLLQFPSLQLGANHPQAQGLDGFPSLCLGEEATHYLVQRL